MELDNLEDALNSLPASHWRDAALSVLHEPGFAFAGRSGTQEASTAKEFADLYQMRFEHIRDRGVNVIGMEALLAALRQRPEGMRICGEPYLGTRSTVFAFWDENKELVGCLTFENADSGEKSFLLAMGKPT